MGDGADLPPKPKETRPKTKKENSTTPSHTQRRNNSQPDKDSGTHKLQKQPSGKFSEKNRRTPSQ